MPFLAQKLLVCCHWKRLQEALHVASGSAKEASHTLLHLLGSLRHAWAVRYVPSSSGPSAAQRVSFPVAVAEFLTSMAEEPDGHGGAASRVGYVLAGYKASQMGRKHGRTAS